MHNPVGLPSGKPTREFLWKGTVSSVASNTQGFSWPVPADARMMFIMVMGGGGGGGGGFANTAAAIGCGGGGGGAGAYGAILLSTAWLPANLWIQVGSGGTGGAGSVNAGAAGAGKAGGTSLVRTSPTASVEHTIMQSGGGGGGAAAVAANPGTFGAAGTVGAIANMAGANLGMWNVIAGAGANVGAHGTGPVAASGITMGAGTITCGGGGGGAVSTAATYGAAGACTHPTGSLFPNVLAGANAGGLGNPGSDRLINGPYLANVESGSGGGANVATAAGGRGGDGSPGCGGGGGGGTQGATGTAGSGGSGGPGFVYICTWG